MDILATQYFLAFSFTAATEIMGEQKESILM